MSVLDSTNSTVPTYYYDRRKERLGALLFGRGVLLSNQHHVIHGSILPRPQPGVPSTLG